MNVLKRSAILAVVLTACGGSSSGVPWGDYDPELRTTIDVLARAEDCEHLQAQFDIADANNAATMERTGHNNAELMTYIDTAMRDAGCFG